MKKILMIAGTRPEAIKMAPVYLEMQRRKGLAPVFCSTGQHPQLIQHALDPFGIRPEVSLDTMTDNQSLTQLTGRLFQQIGKLLETDRPDTVLVQGDTMSAFTGGWCSFLSKIPVVHIEAGLRSGDLAHPYPEEAARRALGIITACHMAPTNHAKENLVKEGVDPANILVTGNTAIDALLFVRDRLKDSVPTDAQAHILVTAHRRENIGDGLRNLCTALQIIARQHPGVAITYAVHPNPAVGNVVRDALSNISNISLVPPKGYEDFVRLMMRSRLIISDSGGVQEEAPALGVPVLVARDTTERPEAIELGANLLVGTEPQRIVHSANLLMTDDAAHEKMRSAGSPYGDGRAAVRICDWLEGKVPENNG